MLVIKSLINGHGTWSAKDVIVDTNDLKLTEEQISKLTEGKNVIYKTNHGLYDFLLCPIND